VRQKDKIREKLLAVYKGLTPLEHALVQLCSVVYDDGCGHALQVLPRHRLAFPQESIAGTGELEQYLIKLQNLKLLNKSLQCMKRLWKSAAEMLWLSPSAQSWEMTCSAGRNRCMAGDFHPARSAFPADLQSRSPHSRLRPACFVHPVRKPN